MANPKENPRQFIIEAALNPNDASLPATEDAVRVLNEEIRCLQLQVKQLEECKTNIKRRMKAA